MSRRTNHEFIHAFDYPMYATYFVGRDSVIVAGGGGAAKTGVPNRMDVVNIIHENEDSCPTAKIINGLDTGTEAVMSISVSNVGGTGSFVISLEGNTCFEYSVVSETASSNDSIHTNDSTALNSNHSQQKDVHPDRVIRKRKSSAKSRKLSTNVSTNCVTPMNNAHPAARETIEWKITKLRQFTIPRENLLAPQNPLEACTAVSAAHSTPPSSSETLTCVTSGGPADFWFAVGSDCGSVFLFDRSRLVGEITESRRASQNDTMKPFLVYPDVSSGRKTGVCALALTTTTATSLETSTSNLPATESRGPLYNVPLLATICEQPCWNLVYLWAVCGAHLLPTSSPLDGSSSAVNCQQRRGRKSKQKSITSTTKVSNQNFSLDSVHDTEMTHFAQPYALATFSRITTEAMPPPSPRVGKRESAVGRSNYRFKHCQFLKSHLDPLSTYQINKEGTNSTYQSSCLLITTMQPLCANRKSVGRLIVWQVPIPARSSSQSPNDHPSANKSCSPLSLVPLTDAALPLGELPACLAVHPSRSRALIGVGTMEGCVEVYFLSPKTFTLSCVYSVRDAHPIFVTALTFLPAHVSHSGPVQSITAEKTKSKTRHQLSSVPSEQFYELVSVSVDRKLCWHSGPRSSQINRLAHGFPLDPVGVWARGRDFLQKMMICYGLIFLFPILLSLVDRTFYGWF